MIKHPKFVRQNVRKKKRVGKAWRKPRGIDNKLRVGFRYAGFKPKIGFRGKASERDKACGKNIVLVENVGQVEALKASKPSEVKPVIASGVGAKKRVVLKKRLRELGF